MMRPYDKTLQPGIDPTMHVHCPIHSEEQGSDGHRRGPVAAHFGEDEYGVRGYVCWHCANAAWKTLTGQVSA